MPSPAVEAVLDTLSTGDVLLFDRQCLKMGDPLAIGLCANAKLASRFDHVATLVKLDPTLVSKSSVLWNMVKNNQSPRNLYVLETNMGGVTLRSLEARLDRSSSNAIAVRKLEGVERDHEFQRKFYGRVEQLAGYPYKESHAVLLQLMMEPPDKMCRREDARLRTLLPPSQVASTDIPVVDLPHFTIDGRHSLNEDDGMVCSELVVSCLQAAGVLADYPSSFMYIPRDFDGCRSHYRMVFANAAYRLSETIFLSERGKKLEAPEDIKVDQPSQSFEELQRIREGLTHKHLEAAQHPRHRPSKPGLLALSQAYALAAIVTTPLYTRQLTRQLKQPTFSRGSYWTLTVCVAARCATAASMHGQLADSEQTLALSPENWINTSLVDIHHPFYDTLFRVGAVGIWCAIMTMPLEALALRYHFNPMYDWYSPRPRNLAMAALLGTVTCSSYCGMFCWPMYHETILPLFAPNAPSLFRREVPSIRMERTDEEYRLENKTCFQLSLAVGVAVNAMLYPLETLRMRYMMSDTKGPTNSKNLFRGFKYGMGRTLFASGVAYLTLYKGL